MRFSIRSRASCAPPSSIARPGDIVAPNQRSGGSGEDQLIARYFRPLAKDPGALGLTDDAAVITPPPGCDLVLKTDGVISGVHFFPDDPAASVAKKVLRMNLSDLAAKGATPLGFLLAIALPRDTAEAWLAAFAQGLGEDAEHYGCPLLGGDTDRTPGPLSVSVTAFGTVPQGTMVLRSGAKPGHVVVVTGTIGDAAIGLRLRRDKAAADRWNLNADLRHHLLDRYLLPQPRNVIAASIRAFASAAMDVSDGLAGDLAKLCRASKASADIDSARVPLSGAARTALAAEPALMEAILTGGDDYEIIATVPPEQLQALKTAAAGTGVAVSEIGRMRAGEGEATFLDADDNPLAFAQPSFSHF
jgi:thiamine-monophosphate kinase